MNNRNKNRVAKLNMRLILQLSALFVVLVGSGVGYVGVITQQHKWGEKVRRAEFELRDLRSFNQVLRSEISTLTSHACVSKSVNSGSVALVAISDQYVARVGVPGVGGVEVASRTASAATGKGVRRP